MVVITHRHGHGITCPSGVSWSGNPPVATSNPMQKSLSWSMMSSKPQTSTSRSCQVWMPPTRHLILMLSGRRFLQRMHLQLIDGNVCPSTSLSLQMEGNGWMFSIDGVLYRPILDSMLYKRYLQRHRQGLSTSHLSSGSGNPLLQVVNNVCMMNCMPPMPGMKFKTK